MTIQLIMYSKKDHFDAINTYQFHDRTFTDHPLTVVRDCEGDKNRYPIIIQKDDVVVGFFCLHLDEGPEMYGYRNNVILLRGYSIDERHRKLGYAKASFDLLDDFILREIEANLDGVILAVNELNIAAQKTYAKVGFKIDKENIVSHRGKLMVMKRNFMVK